jgi:hypothetical protein
VVNGHLYWYQQEWSNQGHTCLQRFTFSGAEPTATFTAKPTSGNEVSFDASGSTAPGGVSRYGWQFNDGPGPSAPVETTSPTVSHTFPSKGPFLVALTVFAKDGTSIGTARRIEGGHVLSAPTVKTEPASLVVQTSATLNATVNPNGSEVSECRFEYGTSEAYGASALCTPPPGSGTSAVPVSAALESLAENTTYHFRIRAMSANGTSFGSDRTFTTQLVLGPHWYKNGGIVEEGSSVSVLAWGTLTLSNATTGAVKCQTISAGGIENPTGGGAGKGKLLANFAYNCAAPNCEAAGGTVEAVPQKPAWSAVLVEEAGVFRDKLEGIGLRVICAASALNVEFHGSLKPTATNGTAIGSAPSKLEFNAAAGSLESTSGAGEMSGKLKLMGYEGQELIQVRNP